MRQPASRRLRLAVRLNHSTAWQRLWAVACGVAVAIALRGGEALIRGFAVFFG